MIMITSDQEKIWQFRVIKIVDLAVINITIVIFFLLRPALIVELDIPLYNFFLIVIFFGRNDLLRLHRLIQNSVMSMILIATD